MPTSARETIPNPAFQPVRDPPLHYQDRIVDQLLIPEGLSALPFERRWTITVGWAGDVSVRWAILGVEKVDIEQVFLEAIAPAWRTAVDLTVSLGGFGPARMALEARAGQDGGAGSLPPSHRPIQRSVVLEKPTEDEIAAVRRELARASGQRAYEPDESDAT